MTTHTVVIAGGGSTGLMLAGELVTRCWRRRMPDLNVVTAGGPQRFFGLLHRARGALLNFGAPQTLDITPWLDHVQYVDARYRGRWEFPVLGEVAAPHAVLVRPDGYVAWVGNGSSHELTDAMTRWFGAPTDGASRTETEDDRC